VLVSTGAARVTITLHRHHWDLLRPVDGMPLHEQTVWSFAPQPAAESFSERTGLIGRRTESEAFDVEAPPFSQLEGPRLWVQWQKLGAIGGGAKEPDWLPAEIVWRMATKEARGFSMAKKKAEAGPSWFDAIDEAELPRTNGAYENTSNLAPRSAAMAAPMPVERGAEPISDAEVSVAVRYLDRAVRSDVPPRLVVSKVDPIEPVLDSEERLCILAAAVRRAIAALYTDRQPEAKAILEVGLDDAGITEDETR
jgi:hypothetical protein